MPAVTSVSMPPDAPELESLGLTVARLRADQGAVIATFCTECDAFFQLVTGEPDASITARELLALVPPGVDPARKFLFGISRRTRLIALVDLVDGYPESAEWYVGLFLLLPEERGRRMGRAIWAATEAWLRARGGRVIRLIVQEQNTGAARFWTTLGFVDEGRVEQSLPHRTNRCVRFAKRFDFPQRVQCPSPPDREPVARP